MIKLFHATGTRSVRPLWLCYELKLPVEINIVKRTTEYLNSPEWKAISPAGKIPVLQDDGLTIFESGAMLEYILDKYAGGRLRPMSGSTKRAIYNQWCWFSEATLIRPLGLHRISVSEAEGLNISRLAREKTEKCLLAVEAELSNNAYILGREFSAADIMMGYSIAYLEQIKALSSDYPKTLAYLARLMSRDALIRALKV